MQDVSPGAHRMEEPGRQLQDGDTNIRRLRVQCARAYRQRLERRRDRLAQWVRSMPPRRHSNVVACALANKLARTAWAPAAHHPEFKRQEAVMTT